MSEPVQLRSSTVSDVVRRAAATFGDRVAVRFQDRDWTYAGLDAAVTRVAAHLLGTGLEPGARVAAYGKNSDAYLIAFLACARAGLVHVPMNYNLTGSELDYLVDQSGSSVVLADPALAGNLKTLEHQPDSVLLLRDGADSLVDIALAEREATVGVEVQDSDTAQLLYTSGTTSKPKGAIMSHRALVHEYVSCLTALDLGPDDAPLHVMPLYHSAQMHVFILPGLMVGQLNTILETPEPGDVLRRLAEDGHCSFFAAPTLWVAMANHPSFEALSFGGLAKAYYGASIMPGPVLAKWQDKAPSVGFYNCFGQSEIAPLATVLRPEEHADRPDSAGRPVLFVEARVVDGDGQDVPAGELGEIVYRSPQLCDGYWDKPDATAEAFKDGWFHSGDLVRRDDAGYIVVVDRIKDVINTGGVLVASREIEDALYSHPGVAQVAVVGTPDEKWMEKVTAYVVRQPDATVDAETLTAHARTALAGFKVPKEIHFIDDLPRNASGKILKRELRDE
ncbi:fatty acyl-CoA synthetase [Luteipulveratus mongoliensis]|uniref:Acyl-CoA synthetase n=1 Tax=Luteipulveratus mongoliensis TaxID=571913 RepID=A0A0K1JF38_9MICO|nr:fatty acyl-CoA synthetase [Luteipulveratus mongoliensis]AKU15321.1 acyl-CoA synthetase [Luteipulveratus mongoliensis]